MVVGTTIPIPVRQMLSRNAVRASINSNCIHFSESFSLRIIPIFQRRKHRSSLVEEKPDSDSGFNLTKQLILVNLHRRTRTNGYAGMQMF